MITLVRHAATEWSGARFAGRVPLTLSAAGRAQLPVLREHLATVVPKPAIVVRSPALRAQETAEAIATWLGVPILVDERLHEVDFGDVEGLTFAEVERNWPSLAASLVATDEPLVDWPGGESWEAFDRRVAAVWTELCDDSREVLVVAHRGPLRRMLRLALGSSSVLPEVGPAAAVQLVHKKEWRVNSSWSPSSLGVSS